MVLAIARAACRPEHPIIHSNKTKYALPIVFPLPGGPSITMVGILLMKWRLKAENQPISPGATARAIHSW